MASFREPTSLLLVSLVVLQAINLSSGGLVDGTVVVTANDLSSDICSKALDQPFCLQVMKSIPGAAEAPSLESLEDTTIAFSRSRGEETLGYVRSLVGSATDPRLKEDYSSCAENYVEAVGDLEDAQGMLRSKDYLGVSAKASAGMSSVDDCEENFKQTPTPDPSQLPEKNKYFNMLCTIVLMIANRLHGA